jgi:hypothetical protein
MKLIEIKMDEAEIKEIFLEEVKKRLEKIELETMLLDSKQLCRTLSLSWPTVERQFLSDPNFPKLRIGSKWLFNRKEVQDYIDRWSIKVKNN